MYLLSFYFKVDASKFITVETRYVHTYVWNREGGNTLIWESNLVEEVVSHTPYTPTLACAAHFLSYFVGFL
jgi:glutathionylspermidine synthase